MFDSKSKSFVGVTVSFIACLICIVAITSTVQGSPAVESTAPASADQTTKIFLPATVTSRLTKWSRDSVFGVQMYHDSRSKSRFYPALMDSGTTWLRIAVAWSAIEPSNTYPGAFDWKHADLVFAAAERASAPGLRLIGTMETAPVWARLDPDKPDGPINPIYLPDYREYVGALVERYDGDGYQDAPGSPIVDYWEFYNEPDRRLNSSDGRWGQHGAEYAAMLATVYPIVKNRNPDAQVVFGGIAYDFFEDQGGPFVRSFLDDVLAAGGANYFDIFNFHTYPAFAANWLPPNTKDKGPGLYEKTQYLREKLQAAGVNKPMIVTESGWHSNNPPSAQGNPEIQARYVTELFVQSLAADLDVMIWWMLYDPGQGTWDNGLVTSDITPVRKLSFTAYQTVVNMLTGKDFVRVLPSSETMNSSMEAYEFRDSANGRKLYVAWLNPVASNATATLAITAEEARPINLYGAMGGAISDAADGANDGRVHVPVGGRPGYIEVVR